MVVPLSVAFLVVALSSAPARGSFEARPDPLQVCSLIPDSTQFPEIERPVAFDSAGRVLSITPQFARRFGLRPPWTVTGEFVEARLYETSGGFVLVVQRPGGVLERTRLMPPEREALARLVDEISGPVGGMTTGGERADVISEPAGGAFARNQTLAAVLIRGPALAAQTDDARLAGTLYLTCVGATFFATTSMGRKGNITRAQNHLASDGAFRGAAMGSALAYAAGGDDVGGRTRAAAILAGSLVTTGLGYHAGRLMTDGEAYGATWGSTFMTVVTAGAIGAAGGWQGDEPRGEAGGLVGAAVVGYPLGVRWVRGSGFGITSGDISAIQAASVIGVVAGVALADKDMDDRAISGILTGGFVAGSLAGARVFARPYDLTDSQARQLVLGGLAGALCAVIPPVLAESRSGRVHAGFAAAGAGAGMVITRAILGIPRVTRR